jgi:hypothetical protein
MAKKIRDFDSFGLGVRQCSAAIVEDKGDEHR